MNYVHLQNLSTFKIDTKQIKTIPTVNLLVLMRFLLRLILNLLNYHQCSPHAINTRRLTLCTSSHVQRAEVMLLLVANSTDIAGVVLESIFSMTILCSPPPFESLIKKFTILHSYQRTIYLKLAEAIEIKTEIRPSNTIKCPPFHNCSNNCSFILSARSPLYPCLFCFCVRHLIGILVGTALCPLFILPCDTVVNALNNS